MFSCFAEILNFVTFCSQIYYFLFSYFRLSVLRFVTSSIHYKLSVFDDRIVTLSSLICHFLFYDLALFSSMDHLYIETCHVLFFQNCHSLFTDLSLSVLSFVTFCFLIFHFVFSVLLLCVLRFLFLMSSLGRSLASSLIVN